MRALHGFRWWLLVLIGAAWLVGAAPAFGLSVYVADVGSTPSGQDVSQFCAASSGLTPLSPPAVAAGSNPDAVAVGIDGHSVYVANRSDFDNSVSQYDIGASGGLTPKTPAAVGTGLDNPTAIALSPDGKSAYVTNVGAEDVGSGPPTHGVSQYDIGKGGVLSPKSPATVTSGGGPVAVAVSPDSKSVYVVNAADNTVSQYHAGAGGRLAAMLLATVATGSGPSGIAVSPDGKSVYVTNANDSTVSQYDVGAGGALTPKTTATVGAGGGPSAIVVSPDGKSVYVTNAGFGGVSEYDAGPGGGLVAKAPAVVGAGAQPDAIAVAPGGKSVFVANGGDGTVSQYDVGAEGTLKGKATVSVNGLASSQPSGIAVGPAIGCFFFNGIATIQLVGNQSARIRSTLIQPVTVGILVERIVGKRRVRVGRVPFGPQRRGRFQIRWNLRVNGHTLRKGRYVITLRALDKHQHVIALAHPVTITIR